MIYRKETVFPPEMEWEREEAMQWGCYSGELQNYYSFEKHEIGLWQKTGARLQLLRMHSFSFTVERGIITIIENYNTPFIRKLFFKLRKRDDANVIILLFISTNHGRRMAATSKPNYSPNYNVH